MKIEIYLDDESYESPYDCIGSNFVCSLNSSVIPSVGDAIQIEGLPYPSLITHRVFNYQHDPILVDLVITNVLN
ncbi:hypothetical protein DA096_22970 [Vibrio rotiferianus]|uniref:hypothetical protein n=1 Tax=Vibrio rotiferianus TaxID=190895 RepID=UPI00111037E5|nr:hypothetical protein [Vibrio rotiferianus]TMX31369.1 hypothetical protein DA095_25215 [Vibrio rotiferianus]TMX43030.1 hypothetical protein DA093_23130 [Vibrio rotiferianus]TMX60054.1 hypothetical protein DA096_22970 [Vibrio rotiferianus]